MGPANIYPIIMSVHAFSSKSSATFRKMQISSTGKPTLGIAGMFYKNLMKN